MTRPDIREPGDIDAAWLTAVLAEGGVDAEVRSFTAKSVGTGQIGDSVRFTLDYARRGDGAPDSLVGMGGAMTNITAVCLGLERYDPQAVQGFVLERAEVQRQIELYRTRDEQQRRSIVGLQPKRAGVILAGACIVLTVMDKLGQERLTVSDRGLRHGLLAERFGDGEQEAVLHE